MTIAAWKAGQPYQAGDLVRPAATPAAISTALTNPGFDTGTAAGWSLADGMAVTTAQKLTGTHALGFSGTLGMVEAENQPVPVQPGRAITASAYYQQGGAPTGSNAGNVLLRWLDSNYQEVGTSHGSVVSDGSSSGFAASVVSAVAPAGAAYVAIGLRVNRNHPAESYADAFAWNYTTPPPPPGVIFRAVQSGTSGATEPTWPAALGVQVADNTVTWEAAASSRVEWTASPVMQSGDTEPAWATTPGALVGDGTVGWEVVSRRVEDPKCPHSKAVAIMASKVFAADRDIVRFSATANALNWSDPDDAGFLPTGLQQANANDMAVLMPYRGNLAAWNASSFQLWQVDPDPQAMALLDQMEGVGSTQAKAAQPVGNDLFYLASLGVRSIGIANAAENMQAGDIGMPIDELIQAEIAQDGIRPLAAYYPSAGQYWLAFPGAPEIEPPPPEAIPCAAISGNLPELAQGDPVAYRYTVTPGYVGQEYVVTVVGELPTGVSVDPTGFAFGTVESAGAWAWTLVVTPVNPEECGGSTVDALDTRTIYTSTPYPVDVVESMESAAAVQHGRSFELLIDQLQSSAGVQGGEIRTILLTYTFYPPEAIQSAAAVVGGDLRALLQTYTAYPPEATQSGAMVIGGSIAAILVAYNNYPVESFQSGATLLSGSLV